MFLDTIHGIIDRRVLLNYRLDPDALSRVPPPPFQPKLYGGHGVGGVCMIRFKELRPRFVPAWLGLGSENAAHRIAVQWQQDGEQREGVFIPRRDTNSWFNKMFGGRVFPGIFQRSRFEAHETDSSISLRVIRADGGTEIAFAGHLTERRFSDVVKHLTFAVLPPGPSAARHWRAPSFAGQTPSCHSCGNSIHFPAPRRRVRLHRQPDQMLNV